jgi:hypothetical protein
MNHWFSNHVPLAQTNPLKGLSGGFKPGESQQGLGSVIVVLAVILAVLITLWLLARFADRRRKGAPSNSPLLLFIALCRAHGLSWSDRILLWRVARWHRLKHPGRLFLEPERLDPASLSPALRSQARRLHAIQDRLFVGLPHDGARDAEIPERGTAESCPQRESEGAALAPFPLLTSRPILGGDGSQQTLPSEDTPAVT